MINNAAASITNTSLVLGIFPPPTNLASKRPQLIHQRRKYVIAATEKLAEGYLSHQP